MAEGSNERNFLVAVYWIGMLVILALPQYFVWITNEDVELITPIKSIAVLGTSIAIIAGLSIISSRVTAIFELSSFSSTVYSICYWLAVLLLAYVPQHFVWNTDEEADGS